MSQAGNTGENPGLSRNGVASVLAEPEYRRRQYGSLAPRFRGTGAATTRQPRDGFSPTDDHGRSP